MSSPTCVLIVEDEPALRVALAMVLEDEGFDVESAANGAAALEIVTRRRPDLILLDLNMPVMDGQTFLRVYRERCRDLAPVVICSTRHVDGARLGHDIAASVVKPIDVDDLIDLIDRLTSPARVEVHTMAPYALSHVQHQGARAAAL